jgi:aldose 1-epimerase
MVSSAALAEEGFRGACSELRMAGHFLTFTRGFKPLINRVCFTPMSSKASPTQRSFIVATRLTCASGFDKMVWQGQALPVAEHEASVRLTYLSKDGEEGFPGNLTASVTYTLTDNNELRLDYAAATDKPTLINLSNHAYFNLAGGGDVLGHELWMNADHYTVADGQLIPTGGIAPVKDTPMDFTTPSLIGARMKAVTQPRSIYDHNFIINGGGTSLVLAARVRDPQSGRDMEVRTTQPGVQLYTGRPGRFCLETQHFPDSIHHPNFPSTILRPGEKFESTTIYAFSTK